MPAENTRNRHHSEKCSNEATYSVEVFRTQKMASHSTMITGHGHPNSHAAVSRRKGYLGRVNCTIDQTKMLFFEVGYRRQIIQGDANALFALVGVLNWVNPGWRAWGCSREGGDPRRRGVGLNVVTRCPIVPDKDSDLIAFGLSL